MRLHPRRLAPIQVALFLLVLTLCGCTASQAPNRRILVEGTPMETHITAFTSQKDGPCLFIIAGIHGDEVAGWMAAELLQERLHPACGSIYVLSTANTYGTAHDVRRTIDNRDINRTFPGSPDGDSTQRLAWEIFSAVQDAQPVLVIDLHEALPKRENRDFLGNSIIFTSTNGVEALLFALLEETGSGALCSEPFTYYGSAPAGSINYEVTTGLGVPVITIETYREDPLETRIQNHVDIVTFIAEYYGVV